MFNVLSGAGNDFKMTQVGVVDLPQLQFPGEKIVDITVNHTLGQDVIVYAASQFYVYEILPMPSKIPTPIFGEFSNKVLFLRVGSKYLS